MTDTQEEESRRCPSCNEMGIMLNRRRAQVSPMSGIPQGTTVELYECRNDRCPEFLPPERLANGEVMKPIRNRWARQVNPDGTIPPKGTGGMSDKRYDQVSPHSGLAQAARDNLALLAAQDDEKAKTGRAHEILNDLNYRGSY